MTLSKHAYRVANPGRPLSDNQMLMASSEINGKNRKAEDP